VNKLICAPTSLPATEPLEYIDAVIAAGFDGMGLRMYSSPNVNYRSGSQSHSARYPVTGDSAVMRGVRSALDNTGQLFEICSFYVQPDMDLDAIKAPVEFGASLGARYAMVIGDDPDWSRMVDTFARMCEVLAAMEVTAALEAPVARRQSSLPPGMMGSARTFNAMRVLPRVPRNAVAVDEQTTTARSWSSYPLRWLEIGACSSRVTNRSLRRLPPTKHNRSNPPSKFHH
jgi:hypothetical protein